MTLISDYVEQIKERVGDTGFARIVCPRCEGGSTKEMCMTVYPAEDGVVLATCHRASCELGTITVGGMRELTTNLTTSKTSVDNLRYSRITGYDEAALRERYAGLYYPKGLRFLYEYVKSNAYAYVLPILGYNPTEIRGHVVKPFNPKGPKSLTYLTEPNTTGLSWYNTGRCDLPRVYVVEDQFSAISLAMRNLTAIALNGTNLNWDRVTELLKHRWQIVLMLDADATAKAIKYSIMYGSIRPVRLVKDIKNMTQEEIVDLFTREGLDDLT